MKDASYAVSNLRTLRDGVYAYATFSPNWPDGELYDRIEAIEKSIDELIKAIENG